jgi:hypothetical protein
VPWPVYSERFLAFNDQGMWRSYTVPVGKRAVVRCVTVSNSHDAAGQYVVGLPGFNLLYGAVQAASTVDFSNLRHVLYGGESLSGWPGGSKPSSMAVTRSRAPGPSEGLGGRQMTPPRIVRPVRGLQLPLRAQLKVFSLSRPRG